MPLKKEKNTYSNLFPSQLVWPIFSQSFTFWKLRYQVIPFWFFSISLFLFSNASNVCGGDIIPGWQGTQLAGVESLLLSATCNAVNALKISGIHLPTFIGYTSIVLTIPLSSIINTFLTVSVLLISFAIIPYFLAIVPFLSAIIGNGICTPVLQYMSYNHAKCELLLSTLSPNKQVFNFSKYELALANAIISVVHTGVKAFNLGILY